MASVPIPESWSNDEIPDAAKYNYNIRDMSYFLMSPPQAIVSRGTGQSVTQPGAYINFTTIDYDNDNAVDLVVNAQRITVNTSGWYDIAGGLDFIDRTVGNYRIIELHRNGVRINANTINRTTADSSAYAISTSRKYLLAAGDYLQLKFVHDSSTAIAMSDAYAGSYLEARWIGN